MEYVGAKPLYLEIDSEVLFTGAVRRAFAHVTAAAHRYKGRRPKRWKGGPPPLVALVASVGPAMGKPNSVSAAGKSVTS